MKSFVKSLKTIGFMLSGTKNVCYHKSLITFPTHTRHSQVIYNVNLLNYCKTEKSKTADFLKSHHILMIQTEQQYK